MAVIDVDDARRVLAFLTRHAPAFGFDMCGRSVSVSVDAPDALDLPQCPDCGAAATLRVVESDGEIWHWCGICDIGG